MIKGNHPVWAILDESELIRQGVRIHEVMDKAIADALLTGTGVYTVAVDPGNSDLIIRSGVVYRDEEGVYPPNVVGIIDVLMEEKRLARQLIDLAKLAMFSPSELAPLRGDWYDIDKLMQTQPLGVTNPWYPKQLSKKKYVAPRQSFRSTMRSVNRNR